MADNPMALVVDDDAKIRRVLRNVLEDDGFSVSEAEDACSVLNIVKSSHLNLVTLDIQLGRENGMDVLRQIRNVSRVPVIMVTGKDDVIDRVLGLEIGADDYITKPFHVREVLARVHAVLRRYQAENLSTADPEPDCVSYVLDGLTIVPNRLEVIGRDGKPCDVTTADMKLLSVFIERPNRPLSRDQLMDLVGGVAWSPLDRTIDNQVARLRKKIELSPANPKLIKTVRGVGYVLTADVSKQVAQPSVPKSA